MKKIASLLFVACIFLSCKKDSGQPMPEPFSKDYDIATTAEANAAWDQSNYGIYKGVVINAQDSTATMKFNFYNKNSSQPFAFIYRNFKVQDSLVRYITTETGTLKFPYTIDTSMIAENADFYYCYFASYRLGFGPVTGFHVFAQGLNPLMDVQLFNNASLNAVMKETSSNQVFCYEGSYGGQDSGRVAFTATSDSIIGIRASISNPQFFGIMSAPVINGNFTIEKFDDISGNNFIFEGHIEPNGINGNWTKSSTPDVVNHFTSVRTL